MRDQIGIKPKVNTYSYRTPYPPTYDLIPLPNWYKVPDFTKFSGQDDTSTMEHVNRFIIQCGEAANRYELRVHLFSSSLSGSAFTWFISLPPNSVITWADLEKQFHKYFILESMRRRSPIWSNSSNAMMNRLKVLYRGYGRSRTNVIVWFWTIDS